MRAGTKKSGTERPSEGNNDHGSMNFQFPGEWVNGQIYSDKSDSFHSAGKDFDE
jgi:hypothetical protein